VLCATMAALVAVVGVPAAISKPRKRTPPPRPPAVEELQNLWGEASEEEARLIAELGAATVARKDHANAARKLFSQVRDTERRLKAVEVELAAREAAHGELRARLDQANAVLGEARRSLTEVLVALYHRGGDFPASFHAALMLDNVTPHDLFAAARYLREVAEGRDREVEQFLDLRHGAENLEAEAAARSAEVAAVRAGLAQEHQNLESLRKEQLEAGKAATAEAAREARLLAKAQSRKAQVEADLARFYAESSSIADWLRTRQAKQRLAPAKRRTFQAPVVPAKVSSPFGARHHPILGDLRLHAGVDYDIGAGAPVMAAGPGAVAWSAPRGGYGNLVVIDHGNGLATLYAHLQRTEARIGQTVKAGDRLGIVGTTGLSTGPHLHFEVRTKGLPVDPLRYL
ncbi:MAG: peptidoglycan DD-metalloendopeptidase family protein, partial [Acidimicrobiia bacterium]